MSSRFFLITGDRGVGKSVVCRKVASLLRDNGLDIGGVLTERTASGQGREAMDLATGERCPFGRQERGKAASRLAAPPGSGTPASLLPGRPGAADPLTPGWCYDEDVFRWGNEVFERGRARDVLLVDELGPIEILGGRGWTRPLEQVKAGEVKTAVVVCRPGLLEALSAVVGRSPEATFTVTVANRDELPHLIAGAILG